MQITTTRPLWVLALLWILGGAATAQGIKTEKLDPLEEGGFRLIEGTLTGDEIIDYVIGAAASQIISVDMQTSNTSAYFNILPAAGDTAIFVGSTEGSVADIVASSDGDYLIRVYLMRNAARRGESATYVLGIGLGAPDFADGLAGGPDYWQVSGVGGSGVLNLRAGPATRYDVVNQLRNGAVLENRGCRRTDGDMWCQIRATGTGVTGWVAGRYLTETTPPGRPATLAGGPVGNGNPFDATGLVQCRAAADLPMTACPFGVIRDGPGNAGVWIALGNGTERQILFENGTPVTSSPQGDLTFVRSGDTTTVTVDDETFEIVDAIVSGG